MLSAIRAPYRHRPIDHVIRDLKAVPSNWSWKQRKVITFWDNNLGADRRYFRELCQAMKPLKRYWATQTSMDTLTEESARLMGQAGCRYIYVGLESLAEESLIAANKRHNKVREYRQRIRYLHDNGIVVMSIFLLGLDGDTAEYLKALPDLVDEIGVDIPVYSLPVPIEGTPFRAELKAADRLLPGDLLDGSDSAQLVFRPGTSRPTISNFHSPTACSEVTARGESCVASRGGCQTVGFRHSTPPVSIAFTARMSGPSRALVSGESASAGRGLEPLPKAMKGRASTVNEGRTL